MGDKRNLVNAPQVQSTNDASIVSKCSMANSNYIRDDFVKYFVQKEKSRASLIHLGYYTRAVIISGILTRFIKFLKNKNIKKFQIISCGAGFDTTYWRLREMNLINDDSIYIEIDYPDVVNRKYSLIRESEKLLRCLNIPENEENEQIKKLNHNFYLISADLCDLKAVESLLKRINANFDIPTLFLSECVVTYMKTEDSDKLIKWMTRTFQNCVFFNYEQIHPEDGFGNVMLRHFNKLQSTLHSVLTYTDCKSHRMRYHSLGFESSAVMSEWDLFMYLTDLEERKRVLTLEQFDEFEEFHLKCTHYVVGICGNNILGEFSSEMNFLPGCSSGGFDHFRVGDEIDRLELFGHSACMTHDKILIFGGFNPGGRSKKVRIFNNGKIGDNHVANGENVRFDAMHGSSISFEIKGRSYVGLYGGRTSPNTVINNGYFIILEVTCSELITKSVFTCECGPLPRYRSTMVCHPSGINEVSAWIFGGRTHDLKEALSDFWKVIIQLENEKFNLKWVKMDGELAPCGRMSHSATVCSVKNAMYVTGGLDTRDFTVLCDVWKWSFEKGSWEEVRPKTGSLIPRYSHTSHIMGNVLCIVGGVNTDAGRQPGIALFNLDTLQVIEYSLEPFRTEPVLLFNHASALIKDDKDNENILIIGGGGNCFSFGTYFNKGIHPVPMKQFNFR